MKPEIQAIDKQYFRSLSSAKHNALRKCDGYRIKSGMKDEYVALLLGGNKNTVTNWRKSYKNEGSKRPTGNEAQSRKTANYWRTSRKYCIKNYKSINARLIFLHIVIFENLMKCNYKPTYT